MKAPKIRLGDFELEYIQVPYEERYLLVHYNCNEIVRIKRITINIYGYEFLPSVVINTILSSNQTLNEFTKFNNDMEKYDKYLDSTN